MPATCQLVRVDWIEFHATPPDPEKPCPFAIRARCRQRPDFLQYVQRPLEVKTFQGFAHPIGIEQVFPAIGRITPPACTILD
jgi:hypothetical protein